MIFRRARTGFETTVEHPSRTRSSGMKYQSVVVGRVSRDFMPDKRQPRFNVDLSIRVFGIDAEGRPFSQIAHARNISGHGAKLSGVEKRLRLGDIIGIHFGDKKARCQVIWVVDAGTEPKLDVGVKLVEGQPCLWEEEIKAQKTAGVEPVPRSEPKAKERRKFARLRISFPIELQDDESSGAHMSTNTADIAGNGCYVETRMPLPINKILGITFWMNSEAVHTAAIVRTCDGGVGMGIEFTGLDEATQNQLQRYVEIIARASAPFQAGPERVPTSQFFLSSKT